jgi:hypothetical protein
MQHNSLRSFVTITLSQGNYREVEKVVAQKIRKRSKCVGKREICFHKSLIMTN